MCGVTFGQHCVVVPITGFSSEFIMNTYFNLFSSLKYSLLQFLLLMMPWAVVEGAKAAATTAGAGFLLQSVTGYLGLALVFIWDEALRERFNRYFSGLFLLVLAKFSFWQGEWALGYHFLRFRPFPNVSQFPKILSPKTLGNSHIPCL